MRQFILLNLLVRENNFENILIEKGKTWQLDFSNASRRYKTRQKKKKTTHTDVWWTLVHTVMHIGMQCGTCHITL
jgi:hypothetical protein